MSIVTRSVVREQIELDAEAGVTDFVHKSGERFDLSEEQTAQLLASIAQAERGELVDADEVLLELRAR